MKPDTKLELEKLLQMCLEKDRKAQKQLFEKFGPTMKMVCRRYLFDAALVDEVLNQGFMKVFTKLSSYKREGSFEGWVRKIMVRECLNSNRKKKQYLAISEQDENEFFKNTAEVDANADVDHLLKVIESLPALYRTIFNLIEIEGYSHDEVAKELKISKSTSRSQLSRAKQLLRKKLNNIKGL